MPEEYFLRATFIAHHANGEKKRSMKLCCFFQDDDETAQVHAQTFIQQGQDLLRAESIGSRAGDVTRVDVKYNLARLIPVLPEHD